MQLPLTILIDRSGRIAFARAGIADELEVEKKIRELLK